MVQMDTNMQSNHVHRVRRSCVLTSDGFDGYSEYSTWTKPVGLPTENGKVALGGNDNNGYRIKMVGTRAAQCIYYSGKPFGVVARLPLPLRHRVHLPPMDVHAQGVVLVARETYMDGMGSR